VAVVDAAGGAVVAVALPTVISESSVVALPMAVVDSVALPHIVVDSAARLHKLRLVELLTVDLIVAAAAVMVTQADQEDKPLGGKYYRGSGVSSIHFLGFCL